MYIDLLFLVLIVFFGIVGYIKGFLNQLLSVLLILTIIFLAKPLADWLRFDSGWSWFQRAPLLLLWATSAFVFYLTFLGIGALIRAIKKTHGLMPFDHWMGLALGLVKGSVLMILMGVLFLTLPEESRSQFSDISRDAENSMSLQVSEGVMSFESLASFRSLHNIQNKLSVEEVQLEEAGRKLFEAPARDEAPTASTQTEVKPTQRPSPWKNSNTKKAN